MLIHTVEITGCGYWPAASETEQEINWTRLCKIRFTFCHYVTHIAVYAFRSFALLCFDGWHWKVMTRKLFRRIVLETTFGPSAASLPRQIGEDGVCFRRGSRDAWIDAETVIHKQNCQKSENVPYTFPRAEQGCAKRIFWACKAVFFMQFPALLVFLN